MYKTFKIQCYDRGLFFVYQVHFHTFDQVNHAVLQLSMINYNTSKSRRLTDVLIFTASLCGLLGHVSLYRDNFSVSLALSLLKVCRVRRGLGPVDDSGT